MITKKDWFAFQTMTNHLLPIDIKAMQNHCPINQRSNLTDETSQQESRQDHSSAGINNILDVLENDA